MSKITLSNIISSFLSITKINDNFNSISTAFDNTLSRDGTSPNAMGASIDMNSNRIINLGAPINPTDAVRLQDIGSGGSAGVAWTNITGKPVTFTPSPHTHVAADITDLDSHFTAGSNIVLSSVSGKLQIAASGSLAADWNTLTNKPATFASDWNTTANKPSTFPSSAHTHPESDITGLSTDLANKSNVGHTHVAADTTDFGAGVNAKLTAGSNITLTYNSGTGVTTVSAAGSGASGQKPALLSAFGTIDGGGVNTTGNDAAFTAAQADPESDIYIPDGTYKTTKTTSFLTKNYVGRGTIVTGDATAQQIPANFRYLNTQPAVLAGTGTGVGGWFSGTQTFTKQEYAIVGANIATFDPNRTQYFQSNYIPNSAFLEVDSGNSGAQAYLKSGATAGSTTIAINAAPDASWVGKTVMFANSPDGTVLETRTVNSIGPGNQIVVNSGLTNSYTWNPASGLKPTIFFAHRSWIGNNYVKVKNFGGGDVYGHLVNLDQRYVPKASETHPFMTSTTGQYGGQISFFQNGTYATGWESQYWDNGFDVMAIAQVDTFNRTIDTAATSGNKYWGGTLFKTGGTRPADVAHNVTGLWRVGLDTANASMWETAALVDPTIANGSSIHVTSLNGAVPGMTISIGDAGQYTGTISAINTSTMGVTVSPLLPATPISAGTIVKYTRGGAVVNMALGQRMVFNSTVNSSTGRSGDPDGVWPALYGNTQGDIEMGTETDGFGDYFYIRFNGINPAHNGGAISRMRIRPNNMQYNLDFQCGGAISATNGMTSSGGDASGDAIYVFKAGSGNYIRYNTSTGQFQFYKGNSLAYSI